MKFSEFNKEMQERMCTFPQSVFATLNPDDETDEQVKERQNKFLKLPEVVKDKLVSHETANKIKAIGEHYGLSLLQMAPIARVIRSYYFAEVKLEDMAGVIEKESKISKENAENVAKYLADRIIGKSVAPLVDTIKTEKMTLSKAMETYPNIRNQKITSSPIEVDGESVAPTLNNWINDYYSIVGAGNKDIVKRSSYLYHSRNVKNLSSTDRQKLSFVLKSLDDGSMIEIVSATKEIYFSAKNIQLTPQQTTEGGKQSGASFFNLQKKDEPIKNEEIKADNTKNKEDKSEDVKHVHGNSLELGSIHFKDEKKKGILSFFGRKKNEDGLSFSFSQQFPSEKDNLNKGEEKKDLGKIVPKEDNFFSKITPIEK